MKKFSLNLKDKHIIRNIIILIATIALSVFAGVEITLKMRPNENGEIVVETEVQTDFNMELSDEQVPAQIETIDGNIEVVQAPTVLAIDSAQITEECPEEEECGMGIFIYAPTENIQSFKDFTMGNCFNTDGAFGAQCWDINDMFWQNYAGRRLSTCGTGTARGVWDCRIENAGDQFDYFDNRDEIRAGDSLVFDSGVYGHIGIALGKPHDGYVALLGQNQGGKACDGGGSATNIVNISLNSFLGGFHPKTYNIPEPAPTPEVPDTGVVK